MDTILTGRPDGLHVLVMDRATRQMATDLKRLSHRPVTQFYEIEISRLREELRLKDLVIQQLGQAVAQQCSLDETCGCLACVRERVAEREMAGAR